MSDSLPFDGRADGAVNQAYIELENLGRLLHDAECELAKSWRQGDPVTSARRISKAYDAFKEGLHVLLDRCANEYGDSTAGRFAELLGQANMDGPAAE